MSDWENMETAPRDGTLFLVYAKVRGCVYLGNKEKDEGTWGVYFARYRERTYIGLDEEEKNLLSGLGPKIHVECGSFLECENVSHWCSVPNKPVLEGV